MSIKLENIKEEHLELIKMWRNSEEVKKYMYTEDEITMEQQKKWFRRITENDHEKHFLIKMRTIPIGMANLKEIDFLNKHAEWAFYIGEKKYRGTAAAILVEYTILEYAFNVLNLHKLNCSVLDFNFRTINLHKKIGFIEEGIRREQILKKDKYHNVHLLSMLKSEWETSKNRLSKIIKRYDK